MLKLSRAQRPWGPEGSLGSEEDSNAHLLGTLTLLELRTSVPPVQSKLRITNALSRGNLKKGALDHECPALESGTCLQHRKVHTRPGSLTPHEGRPSHSTCPCAPLGTRSGQRPASVLSVTMGPKCTVAKAPSPDLSAALAPSEMKILPRQALGCCPAERLGRCPGVPCRAPLGSLPR